MKIIETFEYEVPDDKLFISVEDAVLMDDDSLAFDTRYYPKTWYHKLKRVKS